MKKIGKIKIKPSLNIEKSFVSIGFETLDRELWNDKKCYQPLGKSGVKFARCQTGWAKCEKQKGVYDFSWLDDIVDNLLKNGVEPWFNVGYGNPLYMPSAPNPTGVGCVPIYYGDKAFLGWQNFIKALTEHFCDRITHFEIWNEADLKCFWYPKNPNGKEYGEFVNFTTEIIKKHHNNAKTGGCVHSMFDMPFIKAFLSTVSPNNLDFFSFHVYTRTPEHHFSESVKLLSETLNQSGFHNTELWQGESGYPSWAFKDHWLLPEGTDSEYTQAVYQLRRYFLDFKNNIKRSSFFQMADMWEKAYSTAKEITQRAAAHGVLNGLTYTPKQSYYTICNVANIFEGNITKKEEYMHVNADCDITDLLSIQKMVCLKNDKLMYFYYLPTKLGEEVETTFNAQVCTYKKLEHPILIDTLTGEVFECITEERDWHGVYCYKNLPLKDHPLILSEKGAIDIE